MAWCVYGTSRWEWRYSQIQLEFREIDDRPIDAWHIGRLARSEIKAVDQLDQGHIYDNHNVVIKNGIGLAMGNYTFTCATTGDESKVEYTFGYERCADGKVRIFLHHSSVPYVSAHTIKELAEDPAKLDKALAKGGSMLTLPVEGEPGK
jgi:hypothetical protein